MPQENDRGDFSTTRLVPAKQNVSTKATNNMETDCYSTSNPNNSSATSDVISAFLNEEKERNKRRCNVIVHSVDEFTSDNSQERKEYISTISSVFVKHLGVKATIVNATRIGRKREPGSGSRPRLVKVTVASEHEKALLLRNCTKLRDQNNPDEVRKIYVTPDLTPKEQQQNKALRSQLAEMNKEEKKFWIKMKRLCRREINFSPLHRLYCK